MMHVMSIRKASVEHPTGDPNFSVMQGFPAAFSPEESDPFLMLDHYGPVASDGLIEDPDEFPVGWHPHRGMDICSYIITGTGRHADSMGHRGSFPTPGIQWISVGSGIEHAEGGGTPKGEALEGFQIWINVPSHKKMDDPVYGTSSEPLPLVNVSPGVSLRAIAGRVAGSLQDDVEEGPFRTSAPVHMMDVTLDAGSSYTHNIGSDELDNCLVYAYRGSGTLNGESFSIHHVARLDASSTASRQLLLTGGSDGLSVIVFAGKRINEKVAWRGPIVMNTDAEIQTAFRELRTGTFLKKRAPWDYKRQSAFPQSTEEGAEL